MCKKQQQQELHFCHVVILAPLHSRLCRVKGRESVIRTHWHSHTKLLHMRQLVQVARVYGDYPLTNASTYKAESTDTQLWCLHTVLACIQAELSSVSASGDNFRFLVEECFWVSQGYYSFFCEAYVTLTGSTFIGGCFTGDTPFDIILPFLVFQLPDILW